ncbi:MAG: M13 family metallopeptidase [Flavobacteriales bacterium]|nr:M13 family metallopeptidase [Flavobacteriales bacterium]MCL4856744.1 M13 family metallopeptidase [Flavobacteriales bacterium]
MNFKTTLFGLTALTIFIGCGDKSNNEEPKKNVIPAFDLANIDSTALPCEDFYQYAIGNWQKNNPVPETEGRWGSFNILNEANNLKLKAIIEEASAANAKKGTPQQQVGDFYIAAFDSTNADKLGITPITDLLKKIDEVKDAQSLVETMAFLKVKGSGSIFGYYVYIDAKNSSQNAFYLSQGGLGLPDRDYYFPTDDRGKNILAEYEKHIEATFKLTKESEEVAKANAKTIVSLESDLAKVSMTKVERRDPIATYNKMTVDELQKLTPVFDWKSFFASAQINGVNELIVGQPKYFTTLNNIIKKYTIDQWKIYLRWHLLNDFSPYLSSDFEKQNFAFYSTTLRGVKEMKPRWKRALENSNNFVGEQIGKLFVEKHFPEEQKKRVLGYIHNIGEVFKERVAKLEWMSDSTKTKALDKLSKFTYKIGYPDKWKDYSSIEIVKDNFVQNMMNVRAFEYAEMMGKLGKPVDKTEWGMTPQTINAYYNPTMNEIVFPAAILQPPFFNPDADDAVNYGGIGGVIGHEFSHGFDDQGSQFDGDGNLKNWWSDEDRKNFDHLTGKLVDQFNKFKVIDDTYVNGQLTLGENIADLAGITLSYYALLKSYEGKAEPKPIDGFTYKQRFFLGWAQVWASNVKDEEAVRLANVDPHSPTKYRVLGPLTNLVEFDEAFGCKHGDKMVAEDSLRVKIW